MKIAAATLALALALPTISSAGDGRYQMIPYEDGTRSPTLAFLDTKEGRWKVCTHKLIGYRDSIMCGKWQSLNDKSLHWEEE